MARNTTIIRSNYLWDESAAIYEHALKLWESLEDDLDYPILFSQRGVLNLAHTLQDVRDSVRRVEANQLNGIDAEWLDPEAGQGALPDRQHLATTSATRCSARPTSRAPASPSTTTSPGASPARPTRSASTSSRTARSPASSTTATGSTGVQTTRGAIAAEQVALCAAGHTSVLADDGRLPLPIQSHPLQALVSELLEPVHPTVVMSNDVHVYVSQAHKGELVMGAGVDSYNGYGQRGAFHVIEEQMAAAVELFPIFARAHVLRTWGGIVDTTMDASPIVGLTPVDEPVRELRLGHRRLQGHPGRRRWCFAHTIATERRTRLNAPFALDRFDTGAPDRRTRRRRRGPLRTRHQERHHRDAHRMPLSAGRATRPSSTTAARRTCAYPDGPGGT